MQKRVLIVADVSNLYYCVEKRFNGRLDYSKYLQLATNDCAFYRAVAYGANMSSEGDKFLEALHHMGWMTNFKTPNIYPGEKEGEEVRKADWDVGIAIDVVRCIDRFDLLILGSADGDMAPLVSWVQDHGASVHVFAAGISRALKDVAHSYKEIDEKCLLTKRNFNEKATLDC